MSWAGILCGEFPGGLSDPPAAHGWVDDDVLMRLGPYFPDFAAPTWRGLWCSERGRDRLVDAGFARHDQWVARSVCVSDAGLPDAEAVFLHLAYYTEMKARKRHAICSHAVKQVFELRADAVECELVKREVEGRVISVTVPLVDGGDFGSLTVDGDPQFGVGLPPRMVVSGRAIDFLKGAQPGWFDVVARWIGLG